VSFEHAMVMAAGAVAVGGLLAAATIRKPMAAAASFTSCALDGPPRAIHLAPAGPAR
jgi:hypothetical protein